MSKDDPIKIKTSPAAGVTHQAGATPTSLSRRGVLGVGMGAAASVALPIFAGSISSPAMAQAWQPKFFTPQQALTVTALCDLLLPKTSTPSASEAGVPQYIDEALSVASPEEQLEFLGGLAWLDQRAMQRFSTGLGSSSPAQQTELLEEISDQNTPTPELAPGAAFFADLKRQTLFGYYTSKTGRTQALGLPDSVRREQLQGCTHSSGEH
jgi:hypothetical protein